MKCPQCDSKDYGVITTEVDWEDLTGSSECECLDCHELFDIEFSVIPKKITCCFGPDDKEKEVIL